MDGRGLPGEAKREAESRIQEIHLGRAEWSDFVPKAPFPDGGDGVQVRDAWPGEPVTWTECYLDGKVPNAGGHRRDSHQGTCVVHLVSR